MTRRREQRCFICGFDHAPSLQDHHALPPRLGGNDDLENLYVLCANCHQAVEKIYDREFWDRVREGELEPIDEQ